MVGRLRAYMVAVATIGLVVLCLLGAAVDLDRLREDLPAVAILSVLVLVAPFLSIPLSREGRGPTVHVDAPFSFALLLVGGAGCAALVLAASCVLYDLAHRKPLRKLAFNVGAHTVGLAGGAGVWMVLAGGQVTDSSALPAILAGTAVFVAIKAVLVAGAVGLDESVRRQISPARILRQSVFVIVMAQVGVLVIVLAAEQAVLLLLALGPMTAAYLLLRSEARAVLDRDDAEQTARREAELRAQEQEVARKLQETDQMKDDLLAMVSHELRTLLTTVVGALRLLSAGTPLNPDERQEMLQMADRQARRLWVLIEQLLLAAQSDNGRSASHRPRPSGSRSTPPDCWSRRSTRLGPGRPAASGSGCGATAASRCAWPPTPSCRSSATWSTTPASTRPRTVRCGWSASATGRWRSWPSRTTAPASGPRTASVSSSGSPGWKPAPASGWGSTSPGSSHGPRAATWSWPTPATAAAPAWSSASRCARPSAPCRHRPRRTAPPPSGSCRARCAVRASREASGHLR